ncbi:MAG: butyrate kinase [Bacteroidales bacterium]|nr:butyrate kinase [Candidatus Cacconaster equi]
MKILAINPGSTSTKIALFEDSEQVFTKTLRHSSEELSQYPNVVSQFEFRKKVILEALKENNIDAMSINAIVGRGGLLRPIPSGVYEVNGKMLSDLQSGQYGEHASNLGGIIADSMAKEIPGCRAFITDPVVVDEMQDIARVTGHPLFKRLSIFHALNQKAIAKMHAAKMGKNYNEMNLVVVHLGGGTSVAAHRNGLVVDVNDALNGDGPFSAERSGYLPARQVANICFSGKYSKEEVNRMISGKGGTVALLGTNDFLEIEHKMEHDANFKFICDAYLYNIAKVVGEMAVVLKGKVDGILVTGGVAYGKGMMADLKSYVDWIAPVYIYPGEDEMGALAGNGFSVMSGKEEAKIY